MNLEIESIEDLFGSVEVAEHIKQYPKKRKVLQRLDSYIGAECIRLEDEEANAFDFERLREDNSRYINLKNKYKYGVLGI